MTYVLGFSVEEKVREKCVGKDWKKVKKETRRTRRGTKVLFILGSLCLLWRCWRREKKFFASFDSVSFFSGRRWLVCVKFQKVLFDQKRNINKQNKNNQAKTSKNFWIKPTVIFFTHQDTWTYTSNWLRLHRAAADCWKEEGVLSCCPLFAWEFFLLLFFPFFSLLAFCKRTVHSDSSVRCWISQLQIQPRAQSVWRWLAVAARSGQDNFPYFDFLFWFSFFH